MSHSPATPDQSGIKATVISPKAVMPSTEKATAAAKVKQASLSEPSPASTYGDTAGSSTPATPVEAGGQHDGITGITDSIRAAHLDSAIASISGSPMPAHEAKHRPQSGHRSSSTSSPVSDRAQAIREAPTWRGHQQDSLIQGSGPHADDPFVSNGQHGTHFGQGVAASPLRHPDRAGEAPTNSNAQAIFPPQACVFVANLVQTRSDDQLEWAVTAAFSQFGQVYVKVRRDSAGLPYAFAQFENAENAQRATHEGNAMMIDGRPCRTEAARVNRSLYLSKTAGGPVSEDEARHVMAVHGPIERVWVASPTERTMFGLPEGAFVSFQYFADCKSAQANFHPNPHYLLEQPRTLDNHAHQGARAHHYPSPRNIGPSPRRFSPAAPRIAANSCSIYVGNLPLSISEIQLRGVFCLHGRIMAVEIVRKPSAMTPNGINVFAFIQFTNPQAADSAVQESPRMLQGFRLRVEHKEPPSPNARQGFNGSPRRTVAPDAQDAMFAMYFQRGVSVGLSQSQAQVLPPPVYAQYPFYQPYDTSNGQYTSAAATGNNDNTPSFQGYGAGFVPQPVGHFAYPLPTPPFLPYDQAAQQYPVQQVAHDPYQWPTVDDHSASGSGMVSHESL